jgi:manganese/zinc/iron transport system permease protein
MNALALLEPFYPRSLEIFWPILIEGSLVAVSLGLIGCFLVVRGMALLGDALSHSVLPGIVIGFVIGGSLQSPWILVGATAIGLAAALLVQTVHSQSRVKEDASLAIIFTTMFAIGVVLVSSDAIVGQADLDPGCVLYGNLESFIVDRDAIWPMVFITAGLIVLLLVFYRQLLVSTFDPAMAISLGIPAVFIHYAMMTALSLTIVASFEAVGAILAVALLIMPGATARLWTDRMPTMLLLAGVHGIVSTVGGYWLSHESIQNTSAAGGISVAGFVLFLASWLLAPHHGLLVRMRQRRQLAKVMAIENLVKTIDEIAPHAGAAAAGERVADELRMPEAMLRRTIDAGQRAGLLERIGTGLRLSERGQRRAGTLRRAHELWEQYLQHEVGLEADHVHDAAEWIEHHLSEEKLDRIDEILKKSASTGSPGEPGQPTPAPPAQ